MNWIELIHDALKLLAVGLLVLMNAFFVAAELALVRIRATQFGITLASMGLGVAVEPVFRDLLEPLFELVQITAHDVQSGIAIGVGFFVNCYLLIVIGELVPKAIAIRRTLQTALWVASPLNWFYRISYPFIWLLHRSSQFVLQRLGFSTAEFQSVHSEEELRLVLSASQRAAGGTAVGRNIILNALDLRHRAAREVMRPRHEITGFSTDATIADCLALAEKTCYSRFPICEGGDLDKTPGVIHIKDLYALRDKAR